MRKRVQKKFSIRKQNLVSGDFILIHHQCVYFFLNYKNTIIYKFVIQYLKILFLNFQEFSFNRSIRIFLSNPNFFYIRERWEKERTKIHVIVN